MPLLVQIPNHEKLKFATIMVLGRYTEWTAVHPEYLEPQFNYIVNSFQADSKEIVRAAALAIKFFCTDCRNLLSGQVLQLQTFYDQVLDKLPTQSREEVTDGVSSVVAVQPADQTYALLKTYCDPLIQRLMTMANQATDKESKIAMAGTWNSQTAVEKFSNVNQNTCSSLQSLFKMSPLRSTPAMLTQLSSTGKKSFPFCRQFSKTFWTLALFVRESVAAGET